MRYFITKNGHVYPAWLNVPLVLVAVAVLGVAVWQFTEFAAWVARHVVTWQNGLG